MTTTDATFAREITPEYETVGKRRRLVGYTMRLDGELVGFARTHHEAEVTLDELVFELLSSGATATATQLDGGSDADECAAEVVGMLVEVAQTEVAHTNAPDCPCDECMRTSYAFLNTLAPMAADVNALVIRGGDHSAEDCPRIHPIDVTPLLLEVDALLEQLTPHPGPNCYCPDCMRRAVVLTATSYVTKLRFDAGLICQYCGDDHADTTCPQRRSLLAPRVCGNCQGQHSIQACPEIRAALFAA